MLYFLRLGIETARCKPTMGIRRAEELRTGLRHRSELFGHHQITKPTGAEIFRLYAALRLSISPCRHIADLYPVVCIVSVEPAIQLAAGDDSQTLGSRLYGMIDTQVTDLIINDYRTNMSGPLFRLASIIGMRQEAFQTLEVRPVMLPTANGTRRVF